MSGVTPAQLEVFDDPDRDPRGWVMSVAHAALVPYEPLAAAIGQSAEVTLVPVEDGLARLPDRQRRLPFDHERVVELATAWAARQYAAARDPVRAAAATVHAHPAAPPAPGGRRPRVAEGRLPAPGRAAGRCRDDAGGRARSRDDRASRPALLQLRARKLAGHADRPPHGPVPRSLASSRVTRPSPPTTPQPASHSHQPGIKPGDGQREADHAEGRHQRGSHRPGHASPRRPRARAPRSRAPLRAPDPAMPPSPFV